MHVCLYIFTVYGLAPRPKSKGLIQPPSRGGGRSLSGRCNCSASSDIEIESKLNEETKILPNLEFRLVMSKTASLKISSSAAGKDDAFSITDMTSLQAPLDIPIPDPPSQDDEEMETDTNEDDDKKKKKAPKCGFIKGNEKILSLLERVKPEIVALRETIIVVSSWINHLIPKIEDGNDFGVAIQEKILERITAVRTKVDGFQTNINKYFTERGDAVAKASKETHVMDYRSLVHEKDKDIFCEIRVIVMDIRGFYVSHICLRYINTVLLSSLNSNLFFYLFSLGRALRHHQQESRQGDQSQRRGEALHVLKIRRGRFYTHLFLSPSGFSTNHLCSVILMFI
uniref:Proteasome activator complex subunit 2 n=1 Tax=Labrus bergylta TaxID=56723 RepID=A0A3Q3FQ23_9LABR